jgi:tetratricopeptide (TPR) repeat protein
MIARSTFALGRRHAPRPTRLPRVPLAVLGLAIAVAAAGQLGPRIDEARSDPFGEIAPAEPGAELERIRGDVEFWAGRLAEQPRDVIAATSLATGELELSRVTGDLAAIDRADAAIAAAVAAVPDYLPALALQGSIDIALHRFGAAADTARRILAERPDHPTGLALLGDASIELGDLTTARRAVDRLGLTSPGAGSLVRAGHLDLLTGESASGVAAIQAAVGAAIDEGTEGGSLAWYLIRLGDALAATGDPDRAAAARLAAVQVAPDGWAPRAALSRSQAAEGDLDAAIASLDAAIAIVPQPELLARRSDLYELRALPGDAERATADRATLDAIATLGEANGGVYDRAITLYLADHRLEPDRAVAMARAELAVRPDLYGHDALAWALLAAGRADEAQAEIDVVLASGLRDPRILYHAGMIAAARGQTTMARAHLEMSLQLDPAFDPLQASRARVALAELDAEVAR